MIIILWPPKERDYRTFRGESLSPNPPRDVPPEKAPAGIRDELGRTYSRRMRINFGGALRERD